MKLQTKLHSMLFVACLFFTTLSFAVEPLPDNLLAFDSKYSTHLIKQNANNGTIKLLEHFATQQTVTYCGPASAITILNAMDIAAPIDQVPAPIDPGYFEFAYFSQNNFFSDAVQDIILPEQVANNGMTLTELADAIATWGVKATPYFANEMTLGEFRAKIKYALAHDKYIIVNFLRSAMQQQGGGHHSPVAAYDRVSDRFLVLDVARYKYQSYWVTAEDLWVSSKTMDGDLSRGFIVIADLP